MERPRLIPLLLRARHAQCHHEQRLHAGSVQSTMFCLVTAKYGGSHPSDDGTIAIAAYNANPAWSKSVLSVGHARPTDGYITKETFITAHTLEFAYKACAVTDGLKIEDCLYDQEGFLVRRSRLGGGFQKVRRWRCETGFSTRCILPRCGVTRDAHACTTRRAAPVTAA